jgi:hypothetical protein
MTAIIIAAVAIAGLLALVAFNWLTESGWQQVEERFHARGREKARDRLNRFLRERRPTEDD